MEVIYVKEAITQAINKCTVRELPPFCAFVCQLCLEFDFDESQDMLVTKENCENIIARIEEKVVKRHGWSFFWILVCDELRVGVGLEPREI